MSSDKMIVFDYSGTLSLEAPAFAGPDSLMRHLAESGLRDFGIDSPAIFWEGIVNPTWMKGSTSTVGYKKVMLDRIIATLDPERSPFSQVRLSDAVSSFVDAYFSCSRIDPRWGPVLHRTATHPAVQSVIATDHYAEATGRIIGYLRAFGITAAEAREASQDPRGASFIVANSADLGFHKAAPPFWEILKASLGKAPIRHILIIDDFGCNEEGADRYSEWPRVEKRIKKTVLTLGSVFQATVQVVSMPVGTDAEGRDDLSSRFIRDSAAAVERFLISPPPKPFVKGEVRTL